MTITVALYLLIAQGVAAIGVRNLDYIRERDKALDRGTNPLRYYLIILVGSLAWFPVFVAALLFAIFSEPYDPHDPT